VTAVTPECGFSAQETLDGEIIVDGFAAGQSAQILHGRAGENIPGMFKYEVK
jgi:hypothetical protein